MLAQAPAGTIPVEPTGGGLGEVDARWLAHLERKRARACAVFRASPLARQRALAELDAFVHRTLVDRPALVAAWEAGSGTPERRGPRVTVLADHPDPLDVTLRHTRSGRTFSVRALLARLTSRGLLTDRWVLAHGPSLAAALQRGLGARSGPRSLLASVPPSLLRPGRLGICQMFAPTDPADPDGATFGTWSEQLADVAAMGRLSVRRAVGVELYWHVLFPDASYIGEQIHTPATIQVALADPARTESFVAAVYLAWSLGMYLSPSLFTDGGGGAVNEGGSAKSWPGGETTYDALHVGLPSWQTGVMAESGRGFDAYYYKDFVVPIHTPDGYKAFQEFALNVYAEDVTSYMAECARRKCLGLAAFADSVGQLLATVDEDLRTHGGDRITDVILNLELGNELNAFFDQSTEAAMEAGRMLAHLAGPVRLRVPEMRFRIPELSAWPRAGGDSTAGGARWLARVVESMDLELTRWRGFDSIRRGFTAATPDYVRWSGTVADPDSFEWPPLSTRGDEIAALSVADLAHEVGLHWFHAWNDDGATPPNDAYVPEATLIDDLEALRSAFTGSGADVALCMCAGGFPAAALSGTHPGVLQYLGTNETFAATMAVRILLSAVAGGCAHAMLYTYMGDVASRTNPAEWVNKGYTAMGVREDTGDSTTFWAAEDAWRRASWYAVQRLAELLDVARVTPVVVHPDGLMLLHLDASGHFVMPAGSARHGYVAWVDQASRAESASFTLRGVERDGVVLVSLVPRVGRPLVSTTAGGYPTGETVEWEWTDATSGPWERRWGAHLTMRERLALGQRFVDVRVERADPVRFPGLAILFTDMELALR